uniref:Uncharacterized protein n=1 Tax=Brassica campestris TaxID=3711 RepID=A0A3P6BR39_BRACM|nr:unnamed protein product [Brassica rapa]
MTAHLSSLESALLVLEPAWVIRSWKLIKMPCFLIMSRCGSHQICRSFNTISEIVKSRVEMEISLDWRCNNQILEAV